MSYFIGAALSSFGCYVVGYSFARREKASRQDATICGWASAAIGIAVWWTVVLTFGQQSAGG